jgi:hypothetical protein
MPRLAFQRASDSSSASRFTYSSADLAALGLYPVQRNRMSYAKRGQPSGPSTRCGRRRKVVLDVVVLPAPSVSKSV